ncbi:MAG: OPT family oligopeptide transporter [Candidatus Latescibacterota bacterium]|nr:MAG: OPT family oligopeptide transporter [Candidatus Latescibacterota bacterium]
MAIKHLTEEQVRTWTLRQKDEWWRREVYRGDVPQFTLRAVLTGMLLGGVLSLTNLYVGVRTGWTLGVGITAVILAFALHRVFSRLTGQSEFHSLENNIMQSIATAAGYMTAPLIASLPAYMMVTGRVIPMWHALFWMIGLAILGVLFAFPLKRRFINDEQFPFPEGRAAGVVMDALHTKKEGRVGVPEEKLLLAFAGASGLINFIRDGSLWIALGAKRFGTWVNDYWQHWDDFIYAFATPKILGTPLRDLTIRWDTEIVMVGAGGLMGIRTGVSLIIGAVLNYFILAPILVQKGIIVETGFRGITMWSLWGGVAMMTTASLFSFFSKPQMLISAFRNIGRKKAAGAEADVLADIELPMKVFAIGIPLVGGAMVIMGHIFFGIDWWLGVIAIPLVFVFTLIAANATGLTAITPTGALGKLTQLTYAGLAPGNTPTNLITAGITGEVAGHASNLLMNIKPGYMLGGKPRFQAMGHVLGIIAGGFACTPIFYYALFRGNIDVFGSDQLPMIAAMIWKAVAEVLTRGFGILHYTALVAVVIGAMLGILFEVLKITTKNKWPISGVGMGLAFVLRFSDSWLMFLGAFIFWVLARRYADPKSWMNLNIVNNQETICAGVIAGGALIGIVIMVLQVVVGG